MQTLTLRNGIQMPILGYGVYRVSPEETEQCVLDALATGFRYVRNDDSLRAKHGELPVVVHYFYHETITKSAQKQQKGEIG